VLVMLATVIIVVATHDLSKGVISGVVLSALFFVAKISKIEVIKQNENENITFNINGPLFFAAVEGFIESFDFTITDTNVIIDFSNANVWDGSAVGAIDKVVLKYYENNNQVTIQGLNPSSKKLIDKLGIYNDANAKLSTH